MNVSLIDSLIEQLLDGALGLYIEDIEEVDGHPLAFNSQIADPWWNFVVARKESTADQIIQLEQHFTKRGRRLAVLLPYPNDLGKQLDGKGFETFSNDAWLTADAAKIAELPIAADIELARLYKPNESQIQMFCDANTAAFDSAISDDPYAESLAFSFAFQQSSKTAARFWRFSF